MYQSPLYIVPEERLDALQHLDLKLLRKEILLRLDLAGSTTITINGRTYDRNGLIEAVEQLKTDLPQHLQLFRNKPLLAFVESGEIFFFETPESWADLSDPEFQGWLQPLFTGRYAEVFYKCVSQKGFYFSNRLRILYGTAFRLPLAYLDACYERAFSFLQALVREAKERIALSRYEKKGRYSIDPKAADYINPHTLGVFRHLPEAFEPVKKEFGDFTLLLMAMAFNGVIKKNEDFAQFEKSSLLTLGYAARIGGHCKNRPDLIQIGEFLAATQAEYEIKEKTERSTEKFFFGLLVVIAFVFLFFGIRFSIRSTAPKTNRNAKKTEAPAAELRLTGLSSLLPGEWHTALKNDSTTYVSHTYAFHPDQTGTSSFYLTQRDGGKTCYLTSAFTWKIAEGYSRNFREEQLLILYNDKSFRPIDCLLEKLSGNGLRSYYQEIMKKELQSRTLESIILIKQGDRNDSQDLLFQITNYKGPRADPTSAITSLIYTKRAQ